MTWEDKVVEATRNTQLGAIARCVLGRNVDEGTRQFSGKANITSDGFVMCDFTDGDGQHHMGAFVGGVHDLERNVCGVADHLGLKDEERAAWFRAVRDWIGLDYRQTTGLLLA